MGVVADGFEKVDGAIVVPVENMIACLLDFGLAFDFDFNFPLQTLNIFLVGELGVQGSDDFVCLFVEGVVVVTRGLIETCLFFGKEIGGRRCFSHGFGGRFRIQGEQNDGESDDQDDEKRQKQGEAGAVVVRLFPRIGIRDEVNMLGGGHKDKRHIAKSNEIAGFEGGFRFDEFVVDKRAVGRAQIDDRIVEVLIDDFGVGYSSLNLIREISWDVLKIDKSFLPITVDPMDQKYVMFKYLVAMAQNLGLECIVEGVETIEHVKVLKENNCFLAQGFYFDKPLPKEEFETRLVS